MLTAREVAASAEAFEAIYADANGDPALVPWADGRPHPALVTWLNVVAPTLVRCGARVGVVGCGLGDDARELHRRGYDVTAFDCSSTAIEWARGLDPEHTGSYHVADLFHLPPRWRRRFDLVVEVNTIQSLLPERRCETVQAISELVSMRGALLVICRASDAPCTMDDGPPWPMTRAELEGAASSAGLVPADPICTFLDGETPPVRRMRALFRRAPA
jgi:SAM-dependent methyltransferase